jgi:transcriptional regulator with XRE-family HTH domain
MVNMDLPNLRAVRLHRLLTQADLAKLVGMTTASISRLETGNSRARISTVRRLAAALNVRADELLRSSDNANIREDTEQ